MSAAAYKTLRDWQEGISVLGGFLLLIAAYLVNSGLTRRRDRSRNEARAIVAALYGEIVVLREKVAQVARLVAEKTTTRAKIGDKFVAENMPPAPVLFERLVDKIGLLPPSNVLRIVSFYASYEEARGGLRMLAPHNGPSYAVTTFLGPALNAVQESEGLLRRMECEIGAEQAENCDLGDAEAVVDMIEKQYRR